MNPEVKAKSGTPSQAWEISELSKKVPKEWGDGQSNRKGIGHRWVDPRDEGNGIRVGQGNPNSRLAQRVDHVIVRKGGKVIGRDGKPIMGSIEDNASNAHIPLEEWLRWSKWNTP
jgi:hypothetical protein